jgi:hypothetical protein
VTRASLVSFDIDGTLEIGDPPGIVSIALVKRAKELGYLIGSCSDRPISYQEAMWAGHGVVPDFTVLKHRLGDLKARFAAAAYYHVGDTDVDEHFARVAGFVFLNADVAGQRAWGPALLGAPPSWPVGAPIDGKAYTVEPRPT